MSSPSGHGFPYRNSSFTRFRLGTNKVPQRNYVTKILPNSSGELSGAICLKTLVFTRQRPGKPLELFRKVFGAVRAIIRRCPSKTKPKKGPKREVHEFRPFL